MADAGEYQCTASNEGGSTTYTCKLSIENGEKINVLFTYLHYYCLCLNIETIKQSFSRLDKLATKPQSAEDLMPTSAAKTL